jgi:hypothetical protein
MHTGCMRPAGSFWLASAKPPRVACVCVCYHSKSRNLIDSPDGFRLQLVTILWVYPAFPLT